MAEISINKKIINHIKENNLIGIALKRESLNFGWAGCRDVIQGEFIKDMTQIEAKTLEYDIQEIEGIKVFIPTYLKNLKTINIKSNFFSLFAKKMIIDIEAE